MYITPHKDLLAVHSSRDINTLKNCTDSPIRLAYHAFTISTLRFYIYNSSTTLGIISKSKFKMLFCGM